MRVSLLCLVVIVVTSYAQDRFHLVTTFFPSGRLKEHVLAAQENINNSAIECTLSFPRFIYSRLTLSITALHFLAEEDDPTLYLIDPERKVTTHYVKKQPTYKDFFQYANDHLSGQLAIITNNDIYFDYTLSYLTRQHLSLAHRVKR